MRVARHGAVKACTAALNQSHSLVIAAPESLRAKLTCGALVQRCSKLSVDADRLANPVEATKAALAAVAARITALTAEIRSAHKRLRPVVTTTVPRTSKLFCVGPEVAGQLLTTAGDNPDRVHSEAASAHLRGAAPIPASSGRTNRHRLNRGGDRACQLCRPRPHALRRPHPRLRAPTHHRRPVQERDHPLS
jgi:hypothetical protein